MPKIVDHEKQRLDLSATVASVIAEAGLENTTLRTVAAYHGCTKGMVQHYFADKDELLLGALGFLIKRQAERCPQPQAGRDDLELLAGRCEAWLPLKPVLHLEWRARFAFMGLAGLSEAVYELLAGEQAAERSAMLTLLRRAQRRKLLRAGLSPAAACRCVSASVTGIAASAIADPALWTGSAQRQVLKSAIADLRR